MHVETCRNGIKNRCIILTKFAWKRFMKLPSLDLNYDIELKIQGRIYSGKLKLTVERQVKLKWEDNSYNKCWSEKFVSFQDFQTMYIALLVQRLINSSKMPIGHFSSLVAAIFGLTILP